MGTPTGSAELAIASGAMTGSPCGILVLQHPWSLVHAAAEIEIAHSR